ncbi:MAG TPA: protein-glutamate O-methyltransferase CheR [Tepidisphaeraceae bacterium]|nr:protein-glutamate O-methyltransferase CheR [Tepidisphaeraceae bacterium]
MSVQAEFILNDEDFQMVAEMVYKHCGITLNESKRALVQARLAKKIREERCNSIREYVDLVVADASGDKFTGLINAISTNLTSFFREIEHFKYLSDTYIPKIVSERQNQKKRFIAWSAACSSGEEPYSLAMTILESIAAAEKVAPAPPTGEYGPAGWDLKILGTDISTRVLQIAKAGRYLESRLANVPAPYRNTYFAPAQFTKDRMLQRGRIVPMQNHDEYEVCPLLRRVVRLRHLNLIEAWPFQGPFDVIFCRNVMIYFDRETQIDLVSRFWQCLAVGGLLFTGHSESLTGIPHRFKHIRPTVYAKV